jgi:hypothetical protein
LKDSALGFNPVNPVVPNILFKITDLVFNAEHLCNANGGAIPKHILLVFFPVVLGNKKSLEWYAPICTKPSASLGEPK